MPIPKPKDNESQDEFVTRCMGNDTMNEEYPENDQRAAICYQTWRDRNKAIGGIERKAISVTLKEDKAGAFTARIATLNVVDADNDVTLSGAFPNKTVLVSAYQHGSWQGALPVGKAVIREDGDEVIAEGEFNLATDTGKEHYEAIKFLGSLQEWSYGFRATEYELSKRDEKDVRLLKKVDPFEISPVIKGAGKDTMTLAIKAEGITFADQAEMALATIKALTERARALATLRQSEGRPLSKANKDRLAAVLASLDGTAADLKALTTEPIDTTLADRALLEFVAERARVMMEAIKCEQ